MGILTRYILRAHVAPFFFALSVLTGILMINTVARRLESLAGKGLPWSVMAEVFVLSLPHILALTLPMAVLVATLFAFSSLAADNEITALKASGVNLNRLLLPLLLVAVLFAMGMVWFNDRLLPETNHQLKLVLLDVQRKAPTLHFKEQAINPIRIGSSARPDYYLQAARIRTNELEDVVIYDYSEGDQTQTIYADSGRMAFNDADTDLFLTLYNGWVNQIEDTNPARFVRTFFTQYQIQIRGVGNELTRSDSGGYRSDREMSLAMLSEAAGDARMRADSLRDEALQLTYGALDRMLQGPEGADVEVEGEFGDRGTRRVQLDRSSYPAGGDSVYDEVARRTHSEVNTYAGRIHSLERRADVHMVEYHKKYAISWAVIVFILLGAPLAVRFPRGGVGLTIAASIGIFAVYYAGLIGGENLADEARASPWLSMWAPNVLFFFVALWGLSRIGKEAATSRGGGWDDMWNSLKGMVTRPFRRLRRSGATSR
jgi:lipopolysaccharide export system permease protein